MMLSAGVAARRKPRRGRLRARTGPPGPLGKAGRGGGDGLPGERAEAEMAVAAGQVQPLDHAGLDTGRVLPAAELERLKAVVDDHLAGGHRRRELSPDA